MLRLFVALLILCTMPQGLLGQAPATQPAQDDARTQRLQTLFSELAHSDADIRERARVELMGMSRSDLPAFRLVVERSRPLLPAQSLVLREIVMQAYLAADSYPADRDIGFLGVQLGNIGLEGEEDAQAEGVLITGRIVGFCGYRMLRTGDVILRLMEQPNVPLRSHAHLAAIIRTFPAGQTVQLEVLRQGQLVRVPILLDARPLELDQALDLDNFQWRRDDRFQDYWNRTFAPLVAEGVS
jgi:hypothetical protein